MLLLSPDGCKEKPSLSHKSSSFTVKTNKATQAREKYQQAMARIRDTGDDKVGLDRAYK